MGNENTEVDWDYMENIITAVIPNAVVEIDSSDPDPDSDVGQIVIYTSCWLWSDGTVHCVPEPGK